MYIAGIDEAGRGALAGPVVAAAVILNKHQNKQLLKDSKKLTHIKREDAYKIILKESLCVGIGVIPQTTIDRVNILQATFLAMKLAVSRLTTTPSILLVDGNKTIPNHPITQKAIVKGDDKVPVISAASIVAKVIRDRIMVSYHNVFPDYNFAQHKGYGTKLHYIALEKVGLCTLHRRSFNTSKQLTLF